MAEDQDGQHAGTPAQGWAHEGAAPAPRRTRDGRVIIGPTVASRYRPGALIGLPLVAAVLAAFPAAGLEQWRAARIAAGDAGRLTELLQPMAVQLVLSWLGLWALLALWALVPLIATHRAALLDEAAGRLALRRGLRVRQDVPLAEVVYAVGEAERGYDALIGIGAPTAPDEAAREQWRIPHIGWDDPGFDGLRVLQAAAGLRPSPPRAELIAASRRGRREAAHREMAQRIGMIWRPEYGQDEERFQRDFDHARRVLGGKEPARPGDPVLSPDPSPVPEQGPGRR
ncbi:hypothetical protein [Brachybacterium hainanense]|uniref:DUF4129 domain-containing protein n=1 Tax=Brachybacterium hainanense TaxID=1541174 RepID=A0ABV6RH49_9MICO